MGKKLKRSRNDNISIERVSGPIRRLGYLLSLMFLFSACQDPSEACLLEPSPEPQDILFLGHTYQWGFDYTDRIDLRLERMDFSGFSQIWMGGDMTAKASEKYETLAYLDAIFDLRSENTHWTWGNHDLHKGHPEWIMEFTGRNSFYTHHKDGLTIMVLNTSLGGREPDCQQLEEQFEMIKTVTDTISESSHLIILTHIVVWSFAEAGMNANEVANAPNPWIQFQCTIPRLFDNAVWPKLKQVQERGVQVMVISGDAGKKAKSYQYQTQEGVWFLASGINNSQEVDRAKRALLPRDKLLYLTHDPSARTLDWKFVDLLDVVPACQ